MRRCRPPGAGVPLSWSCCRSVSLSVAMHWLARRQLREPAFHLALAHQVLQRPIDLPLAAAQGQDQLGMENQRPGAWRRNRSSTSVPLPGRMTPAGRGLLCRAPSSCQPSSWPASQSMQLKRCHLLLLRVVAVRVRGLGFQDGPLSKIQNRRGVEQAQRPQHSGSVAGIDVRGVGQRAPCQDLAQMRGHERGFLACGGRRPLVQPGMAGGAAPGAVVVVGLPARPLPVDDARPSRLAKCSNSLASSSDSSRRER